MRGKQIGSANGVPGDGLIPAHAGKTLFRAALYMASKAHPRACGENENSNAAGHTTSGSSPRMRGKRGDILPSHVRGRLIPAHAGKTYSVHPCPEKGPAHPRACGENTRIADLARADPGSSPRMRGKPEHANRAAHPEGLIPAHAGKTGTLLKISSAAQAHPRACGENGKLSDNNPNAQGSSPRMRGKHWGADGQSHDSGLIPAHAGKTCFSLGISRQSRAHPRACGENSNLVKAELSDSGSSPRMRGKQGEPLRSRARARLIPAHAGKTSVHVAGAPP